MRANHPTTTDDDFIPRPVWFAQQLRWCVGPQGMWSWDRVLNEATRRYWMNKPTVEDVA